MRKTSLFILSLLICAVLCTAAVFVADGEKSNICTGLQNRI